MFLQYIRECLELKSFDHALNSGRATNSKNPVEIENQRSMHYCTTWKQLYKPCQPAMVTNAIQANVELAIGYGKHAW